MVIQKDRFSNKAIWKILIITIFLIAATLRFYGLNWDEGFNYTPHPDERAILMKVVEISPVQDIRAFFDKDSSSLNPRWFAYGSFPLYLLKAIYALIGKINLFSDYDIRIIGRVMSATADIITLATTYMIGKRLSGRIAGAAAASFLAVSVISIQNSHFYTVDSLLTLFITTALYLGIEFTKTGKKRYLILTGAMIGFALGCKVSALPIVFSPIAAVYILFIVNKAKGINLTLKENILPLVYCFSCAFLVLAIIQPYMILDWFKYKADVFEQAEVVWRIRDYPYTRQYIGSAPYIYQSLQLLKWGLGVPLGLFVVLGLIGQFIGKMKIKLSIVYVLSAIILPAILCVNIPYPYGQALGLISAFFALMVFVHFRKGYDSSLLVVLAWLIPYLVVTGALEAKFLRYLLPAIPALIIMACVWANDYFFNSRKKVKVALGLVYVVIFLTTLVQALAFVSIYSEKHTAVRASEWINENIKPGSVLIKEHWEEAVPDLHDYELKELPLYEDDTQKKIGEISTTLSSGDYLILFSNRLYGTIPRLPERYPLTTGYYHALFKEKLGYLLVKEATQKQYPKIMGISFVNDTYSKPNLELANSDLNKGTAVDVGYLDESLTVYDHPKILIFKNTGRFNSQQIEKEIVKEAVIKGITSNDKNLTGNLQRATRTKEVSSTQWGDLFANKSLQRKYPVLFWGLAIMLIGFMSLPTTLILFKNLPDKGYGLSKILGISIVGFVVWFTVSWEIFQFTAATVLVCSLFVIAVNILFFIAKRKELIGLLKQHWRTFMVEEMIFVLAFIAFLIIRMLNPDLWHPYRGGEKPMELAHINALTRSLYMPPYDPWYSGGVLNYYYYGHFLVACLIKICGIVPTVAFNLAVPTFFAMTVSGSFSMGFNILSGAVSRNIDSIRQIKKRGAIPWLPFFAGLTTIGFVCLLGNLDGASQILIGVWDKIIEGLPWGGFDYWQSSRMMPPDPPGFEVTEFPFFTFLFADLHPHLISIPFTLLLLAIMLAIVVSPINNRKQNILPLNELSAIVVMGIVLGSVRIINAWDFPTYFLLGCLALMLREVFAHGGIGIVVIGKWLLKTATFYIVSYVAFIPFYSSYENYYSSLQATTNKTQLDQALMIFGVFIFIIIAYFLINNKRIFGFSKIKTVSITIPRAIYIVSGAMALGYLVSGPAQNIIGSTGLLAMLLIGLLGYTTIARLLRFDHKDKYHIFNMLLVITALAIVFGVELVRIKGDIDRMNTVFKFYLQAWVLLGLGCSYLFWQCLKGIKEKGKTKTNMAMFLASCFLIGCGLIYPVFATPARVEDRFIPTKLTLDGKAYMNKSTYMDAKGEIDLSFDFKAITWMNNNLTGIPVVLEANTPMYRWGSRISVYTGYPTILGWRWHQEQQRMDAHSEIQRRVSDINIIYETENVVEALELIKKYRVRYIYVGGLEKLYYSPKGLSKFALHMNGNIEKVYSNQEVDIYKVN